MQHPSFLRRYSEMKNRNWMHPIPVCLFDFRRDGFFGEWIGFQTALPV